MPIPDLVAGDGGSALRVTLTDHTTHEVIDLTGKTVQIRYKLNGSALQTRAMTVLDQATLKGQAQYQFLSADLTGPGELKGEVRLQHGQSDQLTTVHTFHLQIRAPLA